MLRISFEFLHQLFIGRGIDKPTILICPILRFNFFANMAYFLNLAFQVGVLLNEEPINIIKFCLQGYLEILHDMDDLALEIREIILKF